MFRASFWIQTRFEVKYHSSHDTVLTSKGWRSLTLWEKMVWMWAGLSHMEERAGESLLGLVKATRPQTMKLEVYQDSSPRVSLTSAL